MRKSNPKNLPHYFRQVKYQQDRPISAERLAKKQAMREERDQNHKNILQEYKKQHEYYDEEADEWMKNKYYLDLPGQPNYENLNRLISSTFSHARRRQNIFPIVDRHPDFTLRCVYSGRVLSDQKGNMLQKCDQEHSFPQSFQRGTKSGTGRDMHAIFAACKSANGSRGNTPFGIYSQDQRAVEINQYGTLYSGSELKKQKTYIPKINSGAIARSTLYILLCYRGCANENYLPKETLKWLVETAANEEVSVWQKHRNQQLYRLQGNRNPFIDFPKWATKIDFSDGWQK